LQPLDRHELLGDGQVKQGRAHHLDRLMMRASDSGVLARSTSLGIVLVDYIHGWDNKGDAWTEWRQGDRTYTWPTR
jgi:hypothetical protein